MTSQKIAILLPTLGGGGAERLSLELAKQFISLGHQCTFIVGQKTGDLVAAAQSMTDVHSLEASRMRSVFGSLPKVIDTIRPDGVIANIWPLTSIAALALRRIPTRQNIRLASVEHTLLSLQYKNWGLATRTGLSASLAVGSRLSDVCIGVSQGVVDDTARLSRMDAAQFDVVNNPVGSTSRPTNAEILAMDTVWNNHSPDRQKRGRRFLAVGSFKAVKNFPLAISAFARIRKAHDTMIILGDGPLRADLQQLISELGLEGSVSLPGFVEEPDRYYHSADSFVLSSDYEGFGNVLVEALAAGLPIVSTDCPSGPAEILAGGEFGTLVPVGDCQKLAAAMNRGVTKPHANSAKLLARAEDFAPTKIANQYLDLLFDRAEADV